MRVTFDGCVAGALVPLLGGSGQVAFVLDNVEIAAPDDGLFAVELGEIRRKSRVPGLLCRHGLGFGKHNDEVTVSIPC